MAPPPGNRSYDVNGCDTVLIGEGIEIGVLNVHKAFIPTDVLNGEAAHYAELGLQYLDCGDYTLAQAAFEKSLERALGEPELHYHLVLARLARRSPRRLGQAEVQVLERRLIQACRDPSASHAFLLHAFVKHEFYVRNCLRLPPPTPAQLLRRVAATGIPRLRLQELQRHTSIADFAREASVRTR